MKSKSLTVLVLTFALLLSSCASLPIFRPSDGQPPTPEVSGEPAAEQETDAVITLERTVCFGFCPVYMLTIYSDGRVEFNGQQNVKITGKQISQLTPEQVKELLDLFEKANYFELEDEYTAPVTDLPSTITSLTLGGQYKSIRNYGGCLDGSPVPAPSALCELETRIDEVANTTQWIGTP